jgi:hypothetical protein
MVLSVYARQHTDTLSQHTDTQYNYIAFACAHTTGQIHIIHLHRQAKKHPKMVYTQKKLLENSAITHSHTHTIIHTGRGKTHLAAAD